MECSCRLWPIPGIYVVTSTAFVRRTRATLRRAEFGFFGVWVYTRMHTPRFSGQPISAGDLVLETIPSLPIRTSCENVGTVFPRFVIFSGGPSQKAAATNPHARRQMAVTLAWRAAKNARAHEQAQRCTANPERPARNSARTPRGRTTLLVMNRRGSLGFSGLAPHSGRSSVPFHRTRSGTEEFPSTPAIQLPSTRWLLLLGENTPEQTVSIEKANRSVKSD